jgi:hypothetical protein
MSLATWAALVWFQRKQGFFGGLYFVSLVGAMISGLAIIQIDHAWILGLGLSLAISIFLLATALRKLEPAFRRQLIFFSSVGLLIALSFPVGSFASRTRTSQQQLTKQLTKLTQANAALDTLAKQAATIVQTSADQLGTSNTLSATTPVLASTSLVQTGLDFLTLTDTAGTVVVRANHPGEYGDNLNSYYSWLTGPGAEGATQDEYGQPVLVASKPIIHAGERTGTLVGGYILTPSRIAQNPALRDIAVRSHSELVSRSIPGSIFTNPDLARLATLHAGTPFHDTVQFSGQDYSLRMQSIPGPTTESTLDLVSAQIYE